MSISPLPRNVVLIVPCLALKAAPFARARPMHNVCARSPRICGSGETDREWVIISIVYSTQRETVVAVSLLNGVILFAPGIQEHSFWRSCAKKRFHQDHSYRSPRDGQVVTALPKRKSKPPLVIKFATIRRTAVNTRTRTVTRLSQ